MVKDGYKQTEIGIIPFDWEISTLSNVVSDNNGLVRGPFGGALKKEFFVSKGYKVYEQRNAIHKSIEIGSYYINEEKFQELKRFELQESDFIVSCSGTIGKIYQIPKKSPKGIINQALLKIKLDCRKIEDYYFLSVFNSKEFQDNITDNSHGGAMPNLVGMDIFRNTLLRLPPKEEQKAIAKALSDTDELINSLEKLISKKEAIKQGTMQQLLTGKKRLSGFSGEWEEKKLGDIGSPTMCKRIMKYQTSDIGEVPFYKIGTFGKQADSYISYKLYSEFKKKFSFPRKGDVLISASGTIGRIVVFDGKPSYFQDSNIVWIDNNEKIVSNEYLSFIYQVTKWTTEDTTIARLYNDNLKDISILIPPTIKEQKAITQILSDMNNQIESLKSKLSKTKAIKDGMMSELLTGKTRLLIGE